MKNFKNISLILLITLGLYSCAKTQKIDHELSLEEVLSPYSFSWPLPSFPPGANLEHGEEKALFLKIPAREGAHAVAIEKGVVFYISEKDSGFEDLGPVVVIQHGEEIYSIYGNLSQIQLHRGQRVHQFQTIGRVAKNSATHQHLFGQSEYGHLHFELRRVGEAIDLRKIFPDYF